MKLIKIAILVTVLQCISFAANADEKAILDCTTVDGKISVKVMDMDPANQFPWLIGQDRRFYMIARYHGQPPFIDKHSGGSVSPNQLVDIDSFTFGFPQKGVSFSVRRNSDMDGMGTLWIGPPHVAVGLNAYVKCSVFDQRVKY